MLCTAACSAGRPEMPSVTKAALTTTVVRGKRGNVCDFWSSGEGEGEGMGEGEGEGMAPGEAKAWHRVKAKPRAGTRVKAKAWARVKAKPRAGTSLGCTALHQTSSPRDEV